jgi:hypothetical protein
MPYFLAQQAAEILGTDAAICLRHEPHVDVTVVDVARASTERREGKPDLLVCARHPSRFFSLDSRIGEIRPGGSCTFTSDHPRSRRNRTHEPTAGSASAITKGAA